MDKKDKLYSAIEQSDISLMVIDISGFIEYINPGFTLTTGYFSKDILGKKLDCFKFAEFNDKFYQKIWETISMGNSWQGEIKIKKKNGDILWEQVKIYPILNESGGISHFVKIAEDVTNQRHMMDALIRSYDFIDMLTHIR